ncbi:DUF7380 domain-containing protein [Chitinilyticum litopenaei]|uniref:DUF7380 domain-containing protein n=1 Tax=Chitinilyticum litopenaei TaxID=1121276 RepID=UPI0011865901|nr:hypothetical protein [Chitinilyticum litopenaei]
MEHFPTNLAITPDDFDSSGWLEVLESAGDDGYPSLWRAFSNAARVAVGEGNIPRRKVLWLLADACSMRLVPGSLNNPFQPFIVMEGRRSEVDREFRIPSVAR